MWGKLFSVASVWAFASALGQPSAGKMADAGESGSDGKRYWFNLTTSLLKPETKCQSEAFDIHSLVRDDQVQDTFGSCNGEAESPEALQRLCVAAVFYLNRACHSPPGGQGRFSLDDASSFRSNGTCLALASVAPPRLDCADRADPYCRAANATLHQMRRDEPPCSACSSPEGSGLCKIVYFSVTYLASDTEAPGATREKSEKPATPETSDSGVAVENQIDQNAKDSVAGQEEPLENLDSEEKDPNNLPVQIPPEDGNEDVDEDNPSVGDGALDEDSHQESANKPKEDQGHSSFIDKISNHGHNEEPSYFLSYFLLVSIVAIAAYLVFHNKQKILALILEGRRGRQSKGRRRSTSAQYRKLDNNLEEAMGPSSKDSVRHVIY